MKKIWNDEETEFLKNNYKTLKNWELAKIINKTVDQIRWKAGSFELKKEVSKTKTNAAFLEDFDSAESCYWWGFITADGCFNDKQLILSILDKDAEHLNKFCIKSNSIMKYVTRTNSWHSGKTYTMVRTVINDKFLLDRLKAKLHIRNRKTYNPFNIDIFMTKDRILPFLCGITDGDGHISNTKNGASLKIKVHPNWKEQFEQISETLQKLYGIKSTIKINKADWLVFGIYKRGDIKKIFEEIQHTVPFLERKWKSF